MIVRLRALLAQVVDVKDGEMWKFPFSRGFHSDLRYGDRYAAAPWLLQRVLLEQRWMGGPPELIAVLEAAMKASGGTDGKNSKTAEVPSQGPEQ